MPTLIILGYGGLGDEIILEKTKKVDLCFQESKSETPVEYGVFL